VVSTSSWPAPLMSLAAIAGAATSVPLGRTGLGRR
jgi:hypothetical protein